MCGCEKKGCVDVKRRDVWVWNEGMCGCGTKGCVGVERKDVWMWNEGMCGCGTKGCVGVERRDVGVLNEGMCGCGTKGCGGVERRNVWVWNEGMWECECRHQHVSHASSSVFIDNLTVHLLSLFHSLVVSIIFHLNSLFIFFLFVILVLCFYLFFIFFIFQIHFLSSFIPGFNSLYAYKCHYFGIYVCAYVLICLTMFLYV